MIVKRGKGYGVSVYDPRDEAQAVGRHVRNAAGRTRGSTNGSEPDARRLRRDVRLLR